MLATLGLTTVLLATAPATPAPAPVAAVPADSLADTALRDSIAQYVTALGPVSGSPAVFMADMGGDAAPEAVVSFCIDENAPGGASEGASNPANAWCAVTVFSQNEGAWTHVAHVGIGQGEAKGVKGGVITAESVTYAKDDALCCPSVKRTLHLGLRRGKLMDLASPASRAPGKGGKH